MNSLSKRKALVTSLAAGIVGAGALVAACSSSNSGTPGPGTTGPDGSTGNGNGSGPCPNPTVQILFSPMYSAFIAGSSAEQFQIPAVTGDGNTATWTVSDSTQANLQPQTFDTNPGVMITLAGVGGASAPGTTGQITVYATESDGSCGAATLTITSNTQNDYDIGSARYNNGNNLHIGPPAGFDGGGFTRPDGGFGDGGFQRPDGGGQGGGGFTLTDGGSPFETDGGTACTTCHGITATNFAFQDVQHTPEQTGGFSDQDLTDIILKGVVPDGGYFDPSVLRSTCDAGTTLSGDMPACAEAAYAEWQGFHKWVDITTDEMPGVICYLRSLAPQSQTGTSNFGGKPHGDGGAGHHGDGGGHAPPGNDASTGADTGTGADGTRPRAD